MKYLNADAIARKAIKENEELKAKNAKLNANLEYLSMMTDIEIPDEEEEHDEPLE